MRVSLSPQFRRQFRKLDTSLQGEVLEKIELFEHTQDHKHLKAHKLHGRLKNRYSFSVNYRFRIVCTYISYGEAVLLAVGDHEVYK